MENYIYTCDYCSKEYVPNRRKIQKYCSTTCRVKAYYFRKKHNQVTTINKDSKALSIPENKVQNPKTSIDKVSLSGVGNAAIANVATDVLRHIFIPEDSKPATKGDLKQLIAQFRDRYEKITNITPKYDGSQAYYDNVDKKVVYLKMKPIKNMF